ncbi:tRNA (adenosine(37)-N6)-dimethylallyltransferase MiaA [Cohnella sp. REN36]|uniref:tRNA (adenosine(37)-N6)-dimethylallyltransferase MiaA n=1 Tax=Cohnella sp. REN36 TaxID=2887347 RepID=UPI001D146263|nr:tRNA (adenosine(37)-N6)-dimethylallyltransferase MiaA [Cohnella sp. REN36]MCC3373207.1 tRNA (adenosine(37)-N6)-dimethylallyltransferase MiaA [Cohnella sp. REN36]
MTFNNQTEDRDWQSANAADKPPLLVLVGPTAVGKTALSLQIAKAFGCEIISGDSMQVYRGMDIGTAKLPPAEREGIPHHLIDIRDPHEPFSAADFQAACTEAIRDIHGRGRIPFIVGGTGLYVESVCYDFRFQQHGSDEAFRARMQALADERGADALHARLAAVDPASAAKLHPNDVRRIIRALEIYETTGRPLSDLQAQERGDRKSSPYSLALVGLTMDRARLYDRIERRVDQMLEEGLVDEVAGLLSAGVPSDAVAMQALGYKEIAGYLTGLTDYTRAVELLKRDTRHFAKRQLSWFRHMQDLQWVDVDAYPKNSELFKEICAIIAGKFPYDLEYICS